VLRFRAPGAEPCPPGAHAASGLTPARPQNDVKQEAKPAASNGVRCSDPFLLALVSNDHALAEGVVKQEAQLQEEFGEVEQQLQARANETSAQLKHLLDLIQVSRAKGWGQGLRAKE